MFFSFFLKKRLERKACSLVKGNERRAGSKKRQIRAVEFMPWPIETAYSLVSRLPTRWWVYNINCISSQQTTGEKKELVGSVETEKERLKVARRFFFHQRRRLPDTIMRFMLAVTHCFSLILFPSLLSLFLKKKLRRKSSHVKCGLVGLWWLYFSKKGSQFICNNNTVLNTNTRKRMESGVTLQHQR